METEEHICLSQDISLPERVMPFEKTASLEFGLQGLNRWIQ